MRMTEIDARRLSKLVPLLDEVSPAEMRGTLPALVHDGEVVFYVRVPAGKVVYMDGIRPLPATFSGAANSLNRSLSLHDLSQVRKARKSGIPAIQNPMIVSGAIYLGMASKDAHLVLEQERRDVCWFPCAVRFSPDPRTDSKHLTRVVPWLSLCCLRSDDGQPKRGPWIGHDSEHALAIKLRDVLVEQDALENVLRAKEDPLGLRDFALGVYVLYRAAVNFNVPEKGVQANKDTVERWVRDKAVAWGVNDRLFSKQVLKQVRKLINKEHNEDQGKTEAATFKFDVLDDDEARALAKHYWASPRLMLVVHAARYWQRVVLEAGRPWEFLATEDQMRVTNEFKKTLEGWGFTDIGERNTVVSIAIYPVNLPEVRRQLKINAQKTRS